MPAVPKKLTAAKALSAVIRKLLAIGDPDDLLVKVLVLCREFIGADHVSLYLVNGDELAEYVAQGKTLRQSKRHLKIGAEGLTGWCAGKRKLVIAPDVRREKRYIAASPSTRSEADVPIMAGSRLMGVLNFESSKAGFFQAEDADVLELLASQIAVGLRLDESHRHESRLTMELGMLNHLSRAGTMMAPRAFLARAADAVLRTFDCAFVGIFYGDYDKSELILLAQASRTALPGGGPQRQPFHQGLMGNAFRLGETVNARDVRREKTYLDRVPGILSEIDVPIRMGDRCLGILDAQSVELGAFTDDEVQTLETLSRSLVPILLQVKVAALV